MTFSHLLFLAALGQMVVSETGDISVAVIEPAPATTNLSFSAVCGDFSFTVSGYGVSEGGVVSQVSIDGTSENIDIEGLSLFIGQRGSAYRLTAECHHDDLMKVKVYRAEGGEGEPTHFSIFGFTLSDNGHVQRLSSGSIDELTYWFQ